MSLFSSFANALASSKLNVLNAMPVSSAGVVSDFNVTNVVAARARITTEVKILFVFI